MNISPVNHHHYTTRGRGFSLKCTPDSAFRCLSGNLYLRETPMCPLVSLFNGGGTGCPMCLSTSVLAADWLRARGCHRSKGRSFDRTERRTAAPQTCTHTECVGMSHCCRQKQNFVNTETNSHHLVRSSPDQLETRSCLLKIHLVKSLLLLLTTLNLILLSYS